MVKQVNSVTRAERPLPSGMSPRPVCIDAIGQLRCTGCFACQSACPQQAIRVALSPEGFYRPAVDRERCNGCGVCRGRCPVLVDAERNLSAGHRPEPLAFAAWTQDQGLRVSSSSGGIFTELAQRVLADGGAVAGCVWSAGWTPRHVLTDSTSTLEQMRGSKYVPSHAGNIYQDVLARLRTHTGPVLFSGTPCQVAAMSSALNEVQRSRVLLVEVLCHGVPSLRAFHAYLQGLFDGKEITSFTFRDKAFGWHCIRATSTGGRSLHLHASDDAFMQGFSSHHLYMMDACYACPFARLPRVADLTLGDFWGCPERCYDKRGVSVVLVNTSKGTMAIEVAQNQGKLMLDAVTLAEAVARNPRAFRGDWPVPRKRRAFLNGMIEGRRFTELQAAFFPTKSTILWRSFLRSDRKLVFLGKLCFAAGRRLQRMSSPSRQRRGTPTTI